MSHDTKQIQPLAAQIHRGWLDHEKTTAPDVSAKKLAGMIDHTLLKPEATREQIVKLCAEAREHEFASVCVNPVWVPLCAAELEGSPVKVCTVVGFPLGANSSVIKAAETMKAIQDGATEIDMVLAVGLLKSGLREDTLFDIRSVTDAAHDRGAIVKVILENCLLTLEEKILACQLCLEAGADFVKTSTGFAAGGATLEDVYLMRQVVGPDVGVKAAGGIRTYADAVAVVHAGASRLGASAGVKIIEGAPAE
ncbi:MAG TPA: deoxyribose-phosphate aldolase [Bellilinea sp.]|nr:deoxyribose-phosphate aldolase [Bellilinea sp.]